MDDDFQPFLDFIAARTGIRVPDTNLRVMREFLAQRFTDRGVDAAGYQSLILEGGAEYDLLVDVAAIKETYFFREERHFRVIDSHLFPLLRASSRPSFLFWSAACSTGEEAVSLAALAAKHWPLASGNRFSVYASDLSSSALGAFARGDVRASSFRDDGRSFHGLLLPHLMGEDENKRVNPALRERISIFRVNLVSPEVSVIPDGIDLVLLRNAFIYMDLDVRQKVIRAIVPKMVEGACLFLSSSEVPLLSHPELEVTEMGGVYFFRKLPTQGAHAQERRQARPKGDLPEAKKEEPGSALPPPDQPRPMPEPLRALDIRAVCAYANRRLEDPSFEMQGDPHFQAAVYYLDVLDCINRGEARKALSLLDSPGRPARGSEIELYLLARAETMTENPVRAGQTLAKALGVNPDFWPARYSLGTLQVKRDRARARRELEHCARQIQRAIDEDAHPYTFLLEGFNARYFLGMCRRFIEKLA